MLKSLKNNSTASDFRAFIMRGNVLDMAVGIIIGASFGTIVKSLVDDIIMPPIGLLLGNVDFSNLFIVLQDGSIPAPYASVSAAKAAGAVTLNLGLFINSVVSFLILAFAVFLLVRLVGRMKKTEEAPLPSVATKPCPHCRTEIHPEATRCPHCTSELT